MPSRSFSKMMAVRGDGKHDRGYRDHRLFSLREYRGGQLWEPSKGSFSMMPKPSDNVDVLRLVVLHAPSYIVRMGKRRSSLSLFTENSILFPK